MIKSDPLETVYWRTLTYRERKVAAEDVEISGPSVVSAHAALCRQD